MKETIKNWIFEIPKFHYKNPLAKLSQRTPFENVFEFIFCMIFALLQLTFCLFHELYSVKKKNYAII